MNNKEHRQHMHRFNVLKTELMEAQQYRRDMPSDLHNPDTPYWNTYEMLVMYKGVNRHREVMGKELLPFSRIKWAEQQASGHNDYTKKFALYCAELILED